MEHVLVNVHVLYCSVCSHVKCFDYLKLLKIYLFVCVFSTACTYGMYVAHLHTSVCLHCTFWT